MRKAAIDVIKGGIIGALETIMHHGATAQADRDSVRETHFSQIVQGFDMLTDVLDALIPAAAPYTAKADAVVETVARVADVVTDALTDDEAAMLASYRAQRAVGAVTVSPAIVAPSADITNGGGYPAPAMGGAFRPADPSLIAVNGVVADVDHTGRPIDPAGV